MRRWIGLFVLSALLCMSGALSLTRVSASEPVQLNVWLGASTYEHPARNYPEFIEWFEANNPDIKVNLHIYTGDENERFIVNAAVGEPMDVFGMGGNPDRASAGAFMDLRPFLEKDTLTPRDWFHPAILREIDGRDPSRWPYTFTLRIILYNQERFHEAALPLPSHDAETTWTTDEFATSIQRLTRMSGDGTVSRYGYATTAGHDRIRMWIRSFGGDLFDAQAGRVSVDSEAAFAALDFLHDLVSRQYMRIGGASAGALINDEVAAYMGPDSQVAVLEESLAGQYGVAPLPKGPGGTAVRTGAHTYRIVAGTPHPEAAWRYIRDRQLFELGYRDLENLPPRQNLMDFADGAGLSIESDMRQLMAGWVGHPETHILTEADYEGYHLWSTNIADTNVMQAISDFLVGNIPYAEVIERARLANLLIDELLER